jgi:CubicO group peptidase (beta-lactamase class C family)
MKQKHAGFLALAAAIALASIAPAGFAQTTGQEALQKKIDAVMSEVYKPGQPGAAVILRKNGKTIFRKGYGLADLELGVPVEPDMIFRLGSITKQLTAISILMLAEQGKLGLQDEITKFLPDYRSRPEDHCRAPADPHLGHPKLYGHGGVAAVMAQRFHLKRTHRPVQE